MCKYLFPVHLFIYQHCISNFCSQLPKNSTQSYVHFCTQNSEVSVPIIRAQQVVCTFCTQNSEMSIMSFLKNSTSGVYIVHKT